MHAEIHSLYSRRTLQVGGVIVRKHGIRLFL